MSDDKKRSDEEKGKQSLPTDLIVEDIIERADYLEVVSKLSKEFNKYMLEKVITSLKIILAAFHKASKSGQTLTFGEIISEDPDGHVNNAWNYLVRTRHFTEQPISGLHLRRSQQDFEHILAIYEQYLAQGAQTLPPVWTGTREEQMFWSLQAELTSAFARLNLPEEAEPEEEEVWLAASLEEEEAEPEEEEEAESEEEA